MSVKCDVTVKPKTAPRNPSVSAVTAAGRRLKWKALLKLEIESLLFSSPPLTSLYAVVMKFFPQIILQNKDLIICKGIDDAKIGLKLGRALCSLLYFPLVSCWLSACLHPVSASVKFLTLQSAAYDIADISFLFSNNIVL